MAYDSPLPSFANHPDLVRETSEDQLAIDLAVENEKRLRYVGQWDQWMYWTGTKWESDHNLRVYTRARKMLRRIARDIAERLRQEREQLIPADLTADEVEKRKSLAYGDSRKQVKFLLTANKIHSVVSISRSDPLLVSSVADWDSNPWLLNTPGGTVDLRNGTMKKHDPSDFITRQTSVAPEEGKPKRWLAFLTQIMRHDMQMVRYIQKIFGYCLVGDTREHQMYFGYGTGANGKGVMLNTMRNIMGDYGVEATIETFIINDSARHPTELADLRGARLVTCGETDDGQRWAEARIKMLTGGDPVKARFMRQDFFQYIPQFKLFLAGNHKPRLSNVDEAIERRLRLIPFTYTVPRAERDTSLSEKIKAEWPQILQWAIEGCMLWQSEGLEPPEAVADATRGYMSQEDSITAWITEHCAFDPKGFTYTKDLFDSWREWCIANGEQAGTKRTLGRHLEDREPVLRISKARRQEGFGFAGIRLLDDDSEESEHEETDGD
jgi:putative DNA primase/helicase